MGKISDFHLNPWPRLITLTILPINDYLYEIWPKSYKYIESRQGRPWHFESLAQTGHLDYVADKLHIHGAMSIFYIITGWRQGGPRTFCVIIKNRF